MYVVVIAWIYVVLMMSVAEATNSTGTVLGALVTFVLYGLVPIALVVYLMGTPSRKKANRQREAAEDAASAAAAALAAPAASIATASDPASSSAAAPDAGSHPPGSESPVATVLNGGSVPPVGKIER